MEIWNPTANTVELIADKVPMESVAGNVNDTSIRWMGLLPTNQYTELIAYGGYMSYNGL